MNFFGSCFLPDATLSDAHQPPDLLRELPGRLGEKRALAGGDVEHLQVFGVDTNFGEEPLGVGDALAGL